MTTARVPSGGGLSRCRCRLDDEQMAKLFENDLPLYNNVRFENEKIFKCYLFNRVDR